jgi:hypothetical protein
MDISTVEKFPTVSNGSLDSREIPDSFKTDISTIKKFLILILVALNCRVTQDQDQKSQNAQFVLLWKDSATLQIILAIISN